MQKARVATPRASARVRALAAVLIGLAATLAASGLRAGAGPEVDALDRRVLDGWAARLPPTPSPRLLVVVRDPASERRFGAGAWDRAVLARAVGGLARAGAGAIGIDVALDRPSPPGRGGAASDALLAQAVELAGMVVSVSPVAPSAASPAQRMGHLAAPADADGVVRRVPLFVPADGGRVPALGLAVAAALEGIAPGDLARRLPVGDDGALLVPFVPAAALPAMPFRRLWDEEQDPEDLRRLVEGRAVLLLAEPPRAVLRAAGDRALSDVEAQASLLSAILSGARLREAPARAAGAGTVVLAVAGAAVLVAGPWWLGAIGVAALAGAYAAGAAALVPLAGLALPLGAPLLALGLAATGAVAWRQLGSTRRIRDLEGEIGRVQHELGAARDALVSQETVVEALEEDLEAARAAVARSAGAEEDLGRAAEALRAQLGEARAQEERTRRRLDELAHELGGLGGEAPRAAAPGDAERGELARRCAELGIVTRDAAVLALFRDLGKAARASLPILLLGEPGTGKELFARAAHRLGPRAERPFVAVNMGAVPAELFESELFGHVRGGFTGAVADRVGHLEAADGGTIFLDEVGDLRLDHQAKLLRALQERSFHRVGAARPTTVDVRVVAATNRDLERGVAEGWFRGDLYFRLKGVVLRLPPLRERRGDLPLLAARFVEEAAAELGRPGLALSPEAGAALAAHAWPGNVRELQHCLRQAVALAEGPAITRADLRLEPAAAPAAGRPGPAAFDPGLDPGGDAAVLAALRRHGFDMQATARALGWDRSTVTQRLKGMGFQALVESGGDPAAAAALLAGEPGLAPTVETRLREYAGHLLRAVAEFPTPEAALGACRRRFKNLPERHFRSLEILVRRHFDRR